MASVDRQHEGVEDATRRLGQELLAEVSAENAATREERATWLDRAFVALMRDADFRVQALRFVDVMPALTRDAELVRHYREYFDAYELPLPGVLRWGVKRAERAMPSVVVASTIRQAIRTLGKRFIAGESAHEALQLAQGLREQGVNASLDMLGEATLSEAEAENYQARYLELVDDMAQATQAWPALEHMDTLAGVARPRANLSVKLSALYSQALAVDAEASSEAIAARLRPILLAARRRGAFVTVDMEHYDHKAIVLSAFKRVLTEPELGDWPHVGVALQAYLRETEQDVSELIDWARGRGTPVTVRLVRGAYWDYETVLARQHGWPVPVWTDKTHTDASYERCLERLFAGFAHVHTAVATHNVRSIAYAMALAGEHGLGLRDFEFQMLYGMAERLRDCLAARGYPPRVYLPFGELIPGMAYLVRRLLESSSSQSILSMLQIGDEERDRAILSRPQAPPAAEGPAASGETSAGFRNEPVHRFTDADQRARFAQALRPARAEMGRDYPRGFGRGAGEWITSRNPANPSEIVGRVQAAAAEDVPVAIERAQRALPAWRALGMNARADRLAAAAERLRARRDAFAAFEVLEAGKSWREADANVVEAIDFLAYYAAQARRVGQGFAPGVEGETNTLVYEPRGVGVILPPWNFPLAILTGMLSAAIVTGNTAVLKPSSETPVLAARLCALLAEAGLPDGVVTLCPGPGKAVGEALVRDPRTHFVAFTGSREVGLRLHRLAAETAGEAPHIKHVVAEMGGKNAIVVDSDADWDDAVAGVVASAFGYQGQKCSACSRVIVVGERFNGFVERLVEATRSLRIGDPQDPGNFMGPVIGEAQRAKIMKAIEVARGHARGALDAEPSGLGDGYFVGPRIFTDAAPDSVLAQEEIFGPVLTVLRAVDFTHALRLANDTRYALTGGVYSRSPANLEHARHAFEVGNLYLNRKISGSIVGRQPFGGFKLSGMGQQAGGPHYLMQFLQTRTITENTLRRGFAPDSG